VTATVTTICSGGDRLLEVIEAVGDEPVPEQRIVSDRVLAQWIEYVDEVREWDSIVGEFEALVGVDRGDRPRTDGGHPGSARDLSDADVTGAPKQMTRDCKNCGSHEET
jgi:hypothetical protein